MNLYDQIFIRKSIRKYDLTPLTPDMLARVKEAADNAKPLDPAVQCAAVILDADRVKAGVKAPHYLCFYSEDTQISLLNAGFMLQQVCLTLTAIGLGSCWLGMIKPQKTDYKGLKYVIGLAFGRADEPLTRASAAEFKRKSLEKTAEGTEAFADMLEAARLAPSAVNSQPWLFSADNGKLIVSREKLNIVKPPIFGRLNQIDTGIALCHIDAAAEHFGKKAEFTFSGCPDTKSSVFMAAVEFI